MEPKGLAQARELLCHIESPDLILLLVVSLLFKALEF